MSELPVDWWRHGFDGLVGFEVDESGDEEVRAHLVVGERHKQPMGIVHGGVYAAIAESMTSGATARGALARGEPLMIAGQANQASFLRPVSEGTIHAVARRRQGGRTTWVWDVEFSDDAGRLCALVRMTIAVRPARA